MTDHMSDLERNLLQLQERQNFLEETVSEIKSSLKRIEDRLLTNDGIYIRLDRIEQALKTKGRFYWAVVVPVCVSVIAAALRVIVYGI